MTVTRSVDRAVFGVVFLLVFVFSYSEEIVTGFFEAISHEEHELWRCAVIGLDVLIMGASGLLKRSIARSDGRGTLLWRWWWAAVGIVLAGDVVLLAAGEDAPLWLDFAGSTVFIVAMTMIMLSSLNADPLTLFSSAKRAAQPTD